ncbi:PREDICTED: X-linked retinitis pigmentosa GTPase regulator-interacting protein 1 [Gekko japonicus]|uniref:X-linked retinitis pigmentosa GTPase regulator-interacting protein 1 n=1 Tax=Gekko japonicus TaxID=146911 RepID=A0ABM1KQD1_GEKJA|nr:PREDICTED: X-linked retinitis pigmentosa GTPase regulator-interacting protein 1 [Gekko japonicus]
MSLLLLDETAGDIPVRDTTQKPAVIAAIQDVSSSTRFLAKAPPLKASVKASSASLARTRRQVSRVNRTELEDGFLRLHDENLLLKEFAQKQEDRIKRMGTKLLRLNHERSQADGKRGTWIRSSGRNLDLEEDLEDTQERVRELERRNEGLRNRLQFYKQQLQLQGCSRHCPYGYVPPRVNTGLRRVHTTTGRMPERLRKGMRVQGPEVRPTHTAPSRYGDHIAEPSRAETERLTHSLVMAELEMDSETPSSVQGRETDPESNRSQQRYHEAQARRTAIQDNVELIRLQKLLRVKNSELATAKAQLTGLRETYETHLHQNQETLRTASEALLAQVEELSGRLKEETQKVAALESQLQVLLPLQGTLEEFQERVRDLQKERDLLKEDYDKLLESCINAARRQGPDEVPQKDNVPALEEQLSWVMMEKKQQQEQLEEERARNEELKQEVRQLLELAQEAKEAKEVDSSHEKAAILENQSAEPEPQSNPVQSPQSEQERSLKRKLHETEAAHAETVLELEKTRDMLILQHRINRDYQVELDGVVLRAEQEKKDHEEKEQRMARLLDLRSARIHQLEAQLKDVAYGTRMVPFLPDEGDAATEADPDGMSPRLQRGENLLELHISGAVLSAELLRLLGDAEPTTFCTYAFYDFETHSTPLVRGSRPRYGFTSQYVVRAEPLFLQYLQGAAARLDLHLATAVDHTTLASCWLRFGEALGKGEQVHATAALHGPNGEDYGLLEYWVRLRFPIEQILRLHRQQAKALGYLSAGVPRAPVAQEGVLGPGWNEFRVRIESCAGLRSRWLGSQPSPYAMYRFFTFPDHDTVIVPSSNNPHFGDLRTFPLRVTPELHHFLLRESFWVYVFDDEDTEPGNYLGKAQIPLLPLAHGRSVTGDFVLTDPTGKPSGSISLNLEWKLLYVPPEDSPRQASLDREAHRRSLELQIEKEQATLQSPAPSPTAPLRSQHQRKKPRLSLPEPDRHPQKRAELEKRTRGAAQASSVSERRRHGGKEAVDSAIHKVALDKLKEEEEEETPAVAEEGWPARRQDPEAESRAPTEVAAPKDAASEEAESTSEAPTTDSDEVVVAAPGMQEPPELVSMKSCVEVVSLSLHPDSEPVANEGIQQLYVEYHFPGVPLEETETPFSLRKPLGGQEIYFHFSKVIKLDPDPASIQRQLLFSMLVVEEPPHNQLQFVVVSEPLPGARGECEDVGFAYLDLRQILLTGSDVLQQNLPVVSPLDPNNSIGLLRVSVEAAAALRLIYWAGKRTSSEGV